MAASTIVQTRIDPVIREKAAAVFERSGLSISDVMRVVLTRTANEGMIPLTLEEPAGYDEWFRARVQEAIDDPRPGIPGEVVEARFAKLRAQTRKKAAAK